MLLVVYYHYIQLKAPYNDLDDSDPDENGSSSSGGGSCGSGVNPKSRDGWPIIRWNGVYL